MSNIKIMLDAGHGGKDSGAVNASHYEKKYALMIVLKLGQLLNNQGFDVCYIRTTDVFYEVAQRAIMANNAKADYYISIHLNSSSTSSSTGIETLVYEFGGKAEKLAQSVQERLIESTRTRNRGVREQNVCVLRKTNMPAILIETGFINNHNDLSRLITDKYQQKIAQAIFDGVCNYLGIKITTEKETETEDEEIMYKTINDVPSYWRDEIKKLIDDGSIEGDGNGNINLPASAAQALIIMLRHEIKK